MKLLKRIRWKKRMKNRKTSVYMTIKLIKGGMKSASAEERMILEKALELFI